MGPKLLRWAWVLPALAGAALMAWGWPIASDHDLYLHLATGKKIWEQGGPHGVDPFAYTASDAPEETHSWLAQAALYGVRHHFGPGGLRALNFLSLAALVVLVFQFVLHRSGSPPAGGIAGVLTLVAQQPIHTFRPLIFGQVGAALFALWLLDPRHPWSRRRGIGALALTALWANVHGSAVLAPVLVALRLRQLPWAALTAAALCLNPRGPWIFENAATIAKLGTTLEIGEWVTPTTQYPLLWLCGLGTLWLWRQERTSYGVLLCAFASALAFWSHRHVAYLSLALAPLLSRAAVVRPFTSREALIGILLLGAAGRFWVSGRSVRPIAKTADFLTAVGAQGNVFNHPSWGSYLVYRLHPQLRVAHTMRLRTHEHIFRWEREQWECCGGISVDQVVERWPDTQWLLLPAHWPIGFMAPRKDWLPVYVNDTAAVLLRKHSAPEGALDRIASYYRRERIPFSPETGFSLRQALAERADWVEAQQEPSGWGRWPDPDLVSRAHRETLQALNQWVQWDDATFPEKAAKFYWKPGPPPSLRRDVP